MVLDYNDEVFAIVASKLNNDIANIIMQKCKSRMQCFFEEVFNLSHSTLIVLEKENCFISEAAAMNKFMHDLHYILELYDPMSKILRIFANFHSFITTTRIYLHYQNLLKKIALEHDDKIASNTTLFVIKNNKVFLKKGENVMMRMSEIVDFTGKVAIYTQNSPICILEKGDLACSSMLNGYQLWVLFALEDVTITFDTYIIDSSFRKALYSKGPFKFANFCYKDCAVTYDDYKHLSDAELSQYNVQKYINQANLRISHCKITEYFLQYFTWPNTLHDDEKK